MSFLSLKRHHVTLLLCLTTFACSSSQSSNSPTSPTTPTGPPMLSLQQDTQAPVGQAVWLTLASRSQVEGKITLAVSTSNVVNQQPSSSGFFAANGRLKWDATLLEVDGAGAGDFMGGNSGADFGYTPLEPGKIAFFVQRLDSMLVQGTGELFLLRLRPVAGVTSGTTRIDFEPWVANERGQAGAPPFSTLLLFVPFSSRGNVVENTYGATVTIRPGS